MFVQNEKAGSDEPAFLFPDDGAAPRARLQAGVLRSD